MHYTVDKLLLCCKKKYNFNDDIADEYKCIIIINSYTCDYQSTEK